ncbi:MAG: 4'-phosphopantetheinyl transferase superfamily protein [Gammaproteobacteria bacterium]|nr:4'-phosphopantetheinyl transferase superfamily protein [Gammaproteobacteria bacterium]
MNNTIHNPLQVWNIPLSVEESALEPMLKILTEEEKKNAAQFKFDKHRRRYIISHAVMRTILADQLQIPIEKLVISTLEKGKPFIPHNTLFFNLSHSEDLAVLAVSWQGNVGIDVEYMKNDLSTLDIGRRFFHPLEYDQLKNASPEQQHEFFYRCWTGKEAFLKTKGHGVANHLQSFALDFQDSKNTHIIFASDELKEFNDWHVYTYNPSDHFLSTIVSTTPQPDILIRSWNS